MGGITNVMAASGDVTNLRDMLRQLQEASASVEPSSGASSVAVAAFSESAPVSSALPVLENATGQSQTRAGQSGSSSLMARNFYNSNYEKSEYTQASLNGFKTESSFGSKLSGTLNSVIASIDYERIVRETRSPKARIGGMEQLAALRAERATGAVIKEEVHEKSKEHLKKSKEHIEEAAAEALTPESMQNLDASPAPEAVEIAPTPAAPASASAYAPSAVGGDCAAPVAQIAGTDVPRLDIVV